MPRKDYEVAKLSPSFMTGGGGENFERHVAAVFVLSMIVEGLSPIIEAPIKEIKFQAKNRGYDIDDFVVTASQGDRVKKLLCQVKHDVTITDGSSTFQEVITAAWSDFNKSWFNKKADLIALITGFITKDSIDALRYLHEQAHACISAEEFMDRINQPLFTSKTRKNKYDTIKGCIKKANGNMSATDEELWQFFRCFVLSVFDVDYERSVNQVLIHSLIQCKTDKDARLVWSRIADKCGNWKQAAATITSRTIPDDILELFGTVKREESVSTLPPVFSPTAFWAVAALIEMWNEKNENDILAIEKLTGTSYSIFQEECRKYLDTELITLTNGCWKVNDRTALIDAVKDLYFDDTIRGAFQLANEFLKESSKQFNEDGVFDIIIPASGRFSNSDAFRKGLLEGLCILVNGRKPTHCSDYILEIESKKLVGNVLADCDWIRVASLADLVLLLGEICPSAYLDGVEKLIHTKPSEILHLFPKKNTLIFGQNFLTNLLFSLEQLAWHQDYLVQTITCLSALETLEYERTNWANTPMNTMVSILNPYFAQTSATLVKFKNAIQAVKVDNPDVCWNLCCNMLSKRCVLGMTNNVQPKYLMQKEKCNSSLSGKDCDELHEYYTQHVLSMLGTTAERMKRVVKNLPDFSLNEVKEFLQKIRTASNYWDDEEKSVLWNELTDWKNRIVSDNGNQAPVTAEFEDLCRTIDLVQPINILSRYKRLFIHHYDEVSDSEGRWEKKERQKREAVEEIYRTYGLNALVEFGESLNASYDVGYRLGQQITLEDMSNILVAYKTNQNEIFFANMINSFFKKNGITVLKEIDIPLEDSELIAFIFRNGPFTQELLDLIPVYLSENEEKFWEQVRISPYYFRNSDYDVISVVQILMKYHRAPAAITLLGHSVKDLGPDPQLIYKMLIQAPQEQKMEKIDPDSTRELIKYLQDSGAIELEKLSQIEFFYLVWLDEHSEVKPKAIEYMLANEPSCFCELIATTYKKRHDEPESKTIPEAIQNRILQLIFKYSIVPGTDWNGIFQSSVFEKWMEEVKKWSRENDRFEVSMHTVGGALSYVKFDELGLIEPTIMAELNKIENDDLRKGYKLGIVNQRGVHWVDPEGREEKELARTYQKRAENVEKLGYSRFAGLLRDIATGFLAEAQDNIQRCRREEESLLTEV